MGTQNQNLANISFEVTGLVEANIAITDERYTVQNIIDAINNGQAMVEVVDGGDISLMCDSELISVGEVIYADRYFKYNSAKEQ